MLPVRAPLKAALTGLELLLARAQLREETAASHVSLAGVLRPVAGLAGRWRKLELASWKGLLDRTVTSFAEGDCISDSNLHNLAAVRVRKPDLVSWHGLLDRTTETTAEGKKRFHFNLAATKISSDKALEAGAGVLEGPPGPHRCGFCRG